jgi:hypothetical protein
MFKWKKAEHKIVCSLLLQLPENVCAYGQSIEKPWKKQQTLTKPFLLGGNMMAKFPILLLLQGAYMFLVSFV